MQDTLQKSLYRLIIADDEQIIRTGLIHNVDWEELGFSVAADFMDGQDVIEYLEKESADVVLTDIQMCQVSGLEVARWIAQHKPDIKVVIISGYKEFELVKEAMDMNAMGYVLKPFKIRELRSVFMKVRQELEKRNIMETLVSIGKDAACQEAMEKADKVIDVVLTGKSSELDGCFCDWEQALSGLKKEHVSILIHRLVDELFVQIDKSGIKLKESFTKDIVFNELGALYGNRIKEYIRELLQMIVLEIEKKKSTKIEDVITAAKEYIEQHITEDFGVEELAAHLYLNRTYFSRMFKQRTGMSASEYIIQRRMERAAELLRQNHLSVNKIASMVGYADVKYFRKSFQKYTGHTVKEYQKLFQ